MTRSMFALTINQKSGSLINELSTSERVFLALPEDPIYKPVKVYWPLNKSQSSHRV